MRHNAEVAAAVAAAEVEAAMAAEAEAAAAKALGGFRIKPLVPNAETVVVSAAPFSGFIIPQLNVAEEGLYNAQKIEGLGGFPTLKAYMHGEVDDGGIHYTGERDRSELLAFIQRYTAQSYLDLDGPDGAVLVRPGTDATPLEAFVDRYVTRYVHAFACAFDAAAPQCIPTHLSHTHGCGVQPGGVVVRGGAIRARTVASLRLGGAGGRHRHRPFRPRVQARRHGRVRHREERRDAEHARGGVPQLPRGGAGADAGRGGERRRGHVQVSASVRACVRDWYCPIAWTDRYCHPWCGVMCAQC
jgi:hypothetical protein